MEMNFKKISNEAFKDVAPYVDAMLPYINFLDDLYTADYNGHHFVLSEEGNNITIVDNYKGELDTYHLEFDEKGRVVKYIDDFAEYELSFNQDDDVRGVRSTDKLSHIIDQIVYFPAIENDPTINIDFYQYFPEDVASATFNYDVTRRDNSIAAALSYMEFNYPNKIVLSQLVFFMKIFSHNREQIFYEDLKRDRYARAALKLGDTLLPEFNKRYPKDKIMHTLENMGYKVKVPVKMGDLLCGRDNDLKLLQLVTSEYKKQMEGEKIQ